MHTGLGELLSLLSAIAWAVGVIVYRQLGATLPPLTLNFLKNALVMAVLAIAAALIYGTRIPQLTGEQIALSLASGAIGIALADTLYFRALNALGAARMGVIGNLYSPFVIVLSFVFLGERLGLVQLAGFALVMAGVGVVATAGHARAPTRPTAALQALTATATADVAAGNLTAPPPALAPAARPLHGVLLAIVSIMLMAVAIVMVKRPLEAQPLLWITVLRTFGALLGLIVLSALRGELRMLRAPRGLDWKRLVAAALIGQCLAMLLWLGGYKYTSASVAAILNETASIFIVLLAAVWLREPLTRRGLGGVALTLAGVACMLLPST